MAVPVEQFSEMLESAGRSKSGGSHDVFNRDNSSTRPILLFLSSSLNNFSNIFGIFLVCLDRAPKFNTASPSQAEERGCAMGTGKYFFKKRVQSSFFRNKLAF